jgi:hypothetical protein
VNLSFFQLAHLNPLHTPLLLLTFMIAESNSVVKMTYVIDAL